MLQAGEVVAGYVVGQQHWRWRDDGTVKEICVELGDLIGWSFVRVPLLNEPTLFVPRHRLLVSIPVGLPSAIGYGPIEAARLRRAIEQAADRGGPWA